MVIEVYLLSAQDEAMTRAISYISRFLNTMKTAERGRFDAAHELGHLVIHGQGRDLTSVRAEQEANEFASAFLMPRESVTAHMPALPLVDQIVLGKKSGMTKSP